MKMLRLDFEVCVLPAGRDLDELVAMSVFGCEPKLRMAVVSPDGGVAAEVNERDGPWYHDSALMQWLVEQQARGQHKDHRIDWLQGEEQWSAHWGSANQIVGALAPMGGLLELKTVADGTAFARFDQDLEFSSGDPQPRYGDKIMRCHQHAHAIAKAAVNFVRGRAPAVHRWRVVDAPIPGSKSAFIMELESRVVMQCRRREGAERLVAEHNMRTLE